MRISDVDECTTNTHNCVAGQICLNVYGSFRCLDDVKYTSGEATSALLCRQVGGVA